MSTKILGIQFRKKPESVLHEQSCVLREIGSATEVDFVSALDESVDWNHPDKIMAGYQGVVLGGSGEFDFDGRRDKCDPARTISYEFLERLRPLFKYIFKHDVPTLGICYGHQLLGAFSGAQVYYDALQKKACSHEIKLMVDKHDYFLFSNLPESFQAHYGHKDVLDRVPEGAVLLMNGGAQCKVSALRYKNNIYTTQFHPELNFADIVERVKNSTGYLPEGVVTEEIFKDEPHSNTILRNFGKFVLSHSENK